MIRIFLLSIVCLLTLSCNGAFKPKKVDTREVSTNVQERARKNIETGRGSSLGGILNRGTNYEFSTANPMWRASLETLDFLPLTTVDYSGGIIITDWYFDSSASSDESIKITLRFLDNQVRVDAIKVLIHKKTCKNNNCQIKQIESDLAFDIKDKVLKKAALYVKTDKEKAKSKGIKVIERKIKPEEMKKFVGCFLTGAAAEVTPVSEINEFKFNSCNTMSDLRDNYQILVRKRTAA